MKRLILICLMIVCLEVFSGCSYMKEKYNDYYTIQNVISREIHVDVTEGIKEYGKDTHGGFHGDGISYYVLSFKNNNVLKEVKNNKNGRSYLCQKILSHLHME